jgi:hypothetical protein
MIRIIAPLTSAKHSAYSSPGEYSVVNNNSQARSLPAPQESEQQSLCDDAGEKMCWAGWGGILAGGAGQ